LSAGRRGRLVFAERPGKIPARGAAPQRGIVVVLAVAFLLSGGAGLIHEVVWVRLLGHVFGVTAFAVSTVLAAYMGGLALGSYLVGRRAARLADPPRAYAFLEIGIGVLALALPLLLDLAEPFYGWVWREMHVSFAVFSVLRFLVAGGLLMAPTVMMGATLPVLADYLADRLGRRLTPQWLYTVNLFGAVIGVAAGGFVLLPIVGVWGTIVAGAAVNVGIGLAVLACTRRAGRAAAPVQASFEPTQPRPGSLFLAAAFLSGLTSLAAQVAWTRVLSLLIGSTTYAFSTVLIVFLLALAAGSAWASRRGDRVKDVRPDLALVHVLMALGLLGAILAVNSWPNWYWKLFNAVGPESIAGAMAVNAAAVLAILAVPVLLSGAIFPLALVGSMPPGARSTGRAVGLLYAVNTVGAILGATLGGFVLVPSVGSHDTLLVVALLAAAFGSLCIATVRRRRWLTAGVLGGAVLVAAGVVLGPEWDQKMLNAAIFNPRPGGDPRRSHREDTVLFYREGPTATVMVLEADQKVRYMRINGRVNASDGSADIATNVLLSQIPLLLAPRVEDVLVIGLGSGVTAGAALQSPARRVAVVELEPAVVAASRLFDAASHAPLADPRVRLHQDDARHILLASDETYDVIISEPSHPWSSGAANLFTREFFDLAARRLRGGGLFAQWLQTYEISPATFRSLLATFQSVFPEVFVFRSQGSDLILVGSKEGLRIDLVGLERRLSHPLAQVEMGRIGFRRPEQILSSLYSGPPDVRAIVRGVPVNTDDNVRVEFRAPLDILRVRKDDVQRIYALISRTQVESVLTDPTVLLRDRDRLGALIDGLTARQRPTTRYKEILAALG